MNENLSYRLPRNVIPEHYRLVLTPDLTHASFSGEVQVTADVREQLSEIVLNAIELDIHHAEVLDSDGNVIPCTVTYNEAEQQATLLTSSPLNPGSHTVSMRFNGTLNDKLHGFYRSTFTGSDGQQVTIATTQFESTDARRAFPCWDEPDFKATFGVTLVVDDSLLALSNGAEVSNEPTGDGKRRVTFTDTIPMSTYLVAFVVGPFKLTDPIDVDGVQMRVAAVPGKMGLTPFAVEVGAHALRFLRGYFDIDYPGDKIDHVAIPDFAAGAMENLGCVTYRETALLVDSQASSQAERQRVTSVISHETAHMWFGDLVTMKWWNGIWLNEAFATFMEMMSVDAFKPEWKIWTNFGLDKSAALTVDGLRSTRPVEYPVGRPAEAEGMFDVLTYDKGGAVLRMIEQYLGPETFREGIRSYLREHSYGNTETTDLWDSLETASGEPVRAAMDSWIFQGGHPVLNAELVDDSGRVELTQERFVYTGDPGDQTWRIPIGYRSSALGNVAHGRLMMDEPTASINLPAGTNYVVLNEQASGFYRVRYGSELRKRLLEAMSSLAPSERIALMSDTWAMVLAGRSELSEVLEVFSALSSETDPDVWSMASPALGVLDLIARDDDRSSLQAFIRSIAAPVFDTVGWQPGADESPRTARLRAAMVALLGGLGADKEVREVAAAKLGAYAQDSSSVPPDLMTAVAKVVAARGGVDEWEAMYQRFKTATTPQDEVRFLDALGEFSEPELVERTLCLYLSSEVRSQDAPYMLGALLGRRHGADATWTKIEQHWEELVARFPSNSLPRMIGGLPALLTPGMPERANGFLDTHPLNQKLLVEQIRERLAINLALRDRITDTLGEVLRNAC